MPGPPREFVQQTIHQSQYWELRTLGERIGRLLESTERSSAVMEKLTRRLVWLTVALVVLTVVVAAATIVLLFR